MLDVLFVIAAVGFFVVAILYVYGCEWFIKEGKTTVATARIQTTREQAEQ
ncbi:MAG TPA: hypothetical protein VH186_33365 [Chloroflexia bacterium]|nr:hypothetical protein [Chloroflexia bacterium]